MKILNLVLIFLFCNNIFSTIRKEKPDKILTEKINKLVENFHGDVGVYIKNLKTGKSVSINADSLFPTASMIKIPIMCRVFEKIEKGELNYDSVMTYRDSLFYDGDDIVGNFKDSAKITLSKLIMLTITTSDNTASLWCQGLAEGGIIINDFMERNNFNCTKVNSRTKGREEIRNIYGWGVTSPKEMANLVTAIRDGKIVSPRASEEMYRMLSRIYWDGQSLSQIPPTIHVASKQGAVNRSRSEVVLVDAPNGSYVFCVITKNQIDESWENSNEGYLLLRNISKLLWNYYEPKNKWQPAEGMEKFW